MATKGICAVEGCGKPITNSHGWCVAHYKRWWRHGSPTAGRISNGGPLEFLRALVGHDQDDCVPWRFRRYKVGYGKVLFEGRVWKAHRLMCQLAHGEPEDPALDSAHSCGNANCVNPKHIRWATRLENNREKKDHGTELFGERRPNAKLTPDDIRSIRLRSDLGELRKDVARDFGINACTVSQIVHRHRWAHID